MTELQFVQPETGQVPFQDFMTLLSAYTLFQHDPYPSIQEETAVVRMSASDGSTGTSVAFTNIRVRSPSPVILLDGMVCVYISYVRTYDNHKQISCDVVTWSEVHVMYSHGQKYM